MSIHTRATRRPLPVEQSVQWKPLRDSHYVVASLQPADGGRRRLFIRQEALARAERLARAVRGRHSFGLLLGRSYECPVTGVDYLVIESLAEQPKALASEAELAAAIQHAKSTSVNRHTVHIGWYCSAPTVDVRPAPSIAATHSMYFPEPWQTVLVLADESGPPGGAFFLHDRSAARWFYAPFYELLDRAPTPGQPKATCVGWPQYMTVDAVVKIAHDQATAGHGSTRGGVADGEHSGTAPALARRTPEEAAPRAERAASRDRPADIVVENAADTIEKPSGSTPERLLERVRERISARRSRRTPEPVQKLPLEKRAVVDDAEQRLATPSDGAVRRIGDSEDTTAGDKPSRYLELARSEGFFVAAKFDHTSVGGETETLWVLNEPYSGMLLTVVVAEEEVLDASLHCNLRADEAALRTAFPEHRDLASQTIYVRESCVDFLRARCRRLRVTGALEKFWNVSPTIYLLTPGEWQAATGQDDLRGEAGAVRALNDARIAALPDAVRQQFRLRLQGAGGGPRLADSGLEPSA